MMSLGQDELHGFVLQPLEVVESGGRVQRS